MLGHRKRISCFSYSVQWSKRIVLRPKHNTRFIPRWNSTSLKCLMLVNQMIKSFSSWYSVQLYPYCAEWTQAVLRLNLIGHIQFVPVRVGSAVKYLWMWSLLWGERRCKQCYQTECRRKCPSPAERSNRSSPSRWCFPLLHAGPSFPFWKSDIKGYALMNMLFLFNHFNYCNFSGAG